MRHLAKGSPPEEHPHSEKASARHSRNANAVLDRLMGLSFQPTLRIVITASMVSGSYSSTVTV